MKLSSLLLIGGLSLFQLATFDDGCYHPPKKIGDLKNCSTSYTHELRKVKDDRNNEYITLWRTERHFGDPVELEQLYIRAPYSKPYANTLQVPIGDIQDITTVENECGGSKITFYWHPGYKKDGVSNFWAVNDRCINGNCHEGSSSSNPLL